MTYIQAKKFKKKLEQKFAIIATNFWHMKFKKKHLRKIRKNPLIFGKKIES
jgi:hypothetical protein